LSAAAETQPPLPGLADPRRIGDLNFDAVVFDWPRPNDVGNPADVDHDRKD